MSTEAPAARPNLDGLPYETHLNVLVAETQGWQVRFTAEDDAPDYAPGELVGLPPDWKSRENAFFRDLWGDDEETEPDEPETGDWTWIPRFVRDPAAWGALLERERIVVQYDAPSDRWFAVHAEDACRNPGEYEGQADASRIGEAVALAVLAKHGVTPPPRPKENA